MFLPMTLARRHPRFIGTPAGGRFLPSGRETLAMLKTFTATSVAWVFLRSETFKQAFGIFGKIFSHPVMRLNYEKYLPMILVGVMLLILEWLQREKKYFLQIENLPVVVRWAVYCASTILILIFGAFGSNAFIYFQF